MLPNVPKKKSYIDTVLDVFILQALVTLVAETLGDFVHLREIFRSVPGLGLVGRDTRAILRRDIGALQSGT